MKEIPIFRTLFILCLIVTPTNLTMTYLPDMYNSNDYLWSDDITDPTQYYKYIVWAYRFGSQYVDQRKGVLFANSSNIYLGNSPSTTAVQVQNIIANNPSLNLSGTDMPLLFDQGYTSNGNQGFYFPLLFHADSTNLKFYLTLYLTNVTSSPAYFKLRLQDWTTPTPNTEYLNGNQVSIPANSFLRYTVKFTFNSFNYITYQLQDDNFATSYTTSFNTYFTNSDTFTPNMNLYLDDFSSGGTYIIVNAIVLQVSKCLIYFLKA